MKRMSVQTVAINENRLFRKFPHLDAFVIIWKVGCAVTQGNAINHINGIYGGNVQLMMMSDTLVFVLVFPQYPKAKHSNADYYKQAVDTLIPLEIK
jgi:hypothetical protein